MLKSFFAWVKSLFSSSPTQPTPPEVDFPFTGTIKDEPDARDQIFGETKQ